MQQEVGVRQSNLYSEDATEKDARLKRSDQLSAAARRAGLEYRTKAAFEKIPRLDFSKEYLAFIHIPKSAGTTVSSSICKFLDDQGCFLLRDSKVEQFRRSPLDEKLFNFEQGVRSGALRMRKKHPLAPHVDPRRLTGARYFYGHYGVGEEPTLGGRARYFTVLRDPADRFVVNYYFRKMQVQSGAIKKFSPILDRNGDISPTPVDFLNLLERRNCEKWRQTQCRFFGGRPSAIHAKSVIEEKGVHVFPFEALHLLESWLRGCLGDGFKFVTRQRVNQSRPSLSEIYAAYPDLRRRLEKSFEEDFVLYDFYRNRTAEALSRAIDICRRIHPESP